ncbi:MAG: hypothetical protein WCW26_05210, partial [Candidatus Buchananbacteria bacterium]
MRTSLKTVVRTKSAKRVFQILISLAFLVVLLSSFSAQATTATQEEGGEVNVAATFLAMAVILLLAKIGASLVERFGQPGVLGELLVGLLL